MPAKIDIDVERAAALYENEMPIAELAKIFNISRVSLTRKIKEFRGSMRTSKEAAELRSKLGRSNPACFWKGKKQPEAMVKLRASKTTGSNNGRYVDGSQSRGYRNLIKKEVCASCGVVDDLVIHHIDFDHYNNVIENLSVLCVRCHASLHTTARWQREKGAEDIPVSNAPIGWHHKNLNDEKSEAQETQLTLI